MRRNSSEFRKLGKVEWRRIEQPTFPMRMRAMCNQIKSTLVSSAHDPYNMQTSVLLQTGLAPVGDEATWKKWWEGNSVPQSDQLIACNNISQGARFWLEHSELGNPFQRHMLALDSIGLELTRDGEWWRKKFDAQERSLKSLKRVWSTFTKSMCEPPDFPLSFEQQILDGKLTAPSFRHASTDEKISIEIFGSNPYRYEFSEVTRMQYVDSEKFGLFRFFESLLYESRLQQPWLRDIWILDMATLVALMRTELVATPEHDAPGLGYNIEQFNFWNRLFWDHTEGIITPLLRYGRQQNSDSRLERLHLVYSVRERYYELMKQFGIDFEDVYHIAAPVSVFGARKISDNIIYV